MAHFDWVLIASLHSKADSTKVKSNKQQRGFSVSVPTQQSWSLLLQLAPAAVLIPLPTGGGQATTSIHFQ